MKIQPGWNVPGTECTSFHELEFRLDIDRQHDDLLNLAMLGLSCTNHRSQESGSPITFLSLPLVLKPGLSYCIDLTYSAP